ncbi:type II secretion system protein [Vibrio coralliilyticus]|nr:type II secretion system protein [Vibrio coralliilyticus]
MEYVMKKGSILNKQSGFSLNEILVSVAIMGTLAAVGAPYVADMTADANARTAEAAASQVVSEINNVVDTTPYTQASIRTAAKKAGIDISKVTIATQGGFGGSVSGAGDVRFSVGTSANLRYKDIELKRSGADTRAEFK